MSELIWSVNSVAGESYDKVAYYRCFGIEEFVKKIGADNIVGITFKGNNIGFIVKEKGGGI